MNGIYAESSAVLRWLLEQDPTIQLALGEATYVVSSLLTNAEIGRTLRRLEATDQLQAAQGAELWLGYRSASARWKLYEVDRELLQRTTEPLPREPVRTLDAIHLITALRHSQEVEPLTLLSTDQRIRENARGLGLEVLPK